MVKANVDRILDILKEKKSVSINELASKLSLPKTGVEKSAEYLEEDGVVKIDHKFPNTYVTLVEKSKKEDGKKEEKAEQPAPVQEESQQVDMSQSTSTPPPMPMPEQPGPAVDVAAPGMPPPPPPQQESVETQSPVPESPQLPKPEPNLPQEQSFAPVQPTPEQVEEKPKSEPEKKPSKTPFLIDEPLDKKPDLAENVSASINVMQQSPVQDTVVPQPDLNQNPIEPEQPKFDMAPPTPQATTTNMVPDTMIQPQLPGSNIQQPQQKEEQKPSTFASQEEFAPKQEFTFPDYADTDVEKIEYLMGQANDKLADNDYQEINILYRAIYDMFSKSEDLSPNERHLLSEKIQDLFQRIKRLYLVEGVTV